MKVLYGKKLESTDELNWKELEVKVVAIIMFCLADDVMYHVVDDESPVIV